MGRSNRVRPKKLGEKLKSIREHLGLTQEQMVEKLTHPESKLHSQNISGFEKNEREPNLIILLAYARLAEISTDNLIDDDLEIKLESKTKP